jgi:hypothetical protein
MAAHHLIRGDSAQPLISPYMPKSVIFIRTTAPDLPSVLISPTEYGLEAAAQVHDAQSSLSKVWSAKRDREEQ